MSSDMIVKNIELPTESIATFCQRWQIIELGLFGSVLRDDFWVEDSDIDVLVTFARHALDAVHPLQNRTTGKLTFLRIE